MSRKIKIKISDKLYRAMFQKIELPDFDLRNPYDKDLAFYLGRIDKPTQEQINE